MDITRTREAMGLNKTELAARLGVHKSTITRIEAGSVKCDKRTYIAIADLARRMRVAVVM